MRSSYGRFLVPAAMLVGLALLAAPAAEAGGFARHGGVAGHSHRPWPHFPHGSRLRPVRPLPVLVEARRAAGSVAGGGGMPGHMAPAGGAYILGGYGLPTGLPGGGTYAGGIAAVVAPGNGVYFVVDGTASPRARTRPLPPAMKIIKVDPDMKNANCQMEKGVCVIRP